MEGEEEHEDTDTVYICYAPLQMLFTYYLLRRVVNIHFLMRLACQYYPIPKQETACMKLSNLFMAIFSYANMKRKDASSTPQKKLC